MPNAVSNNIPATLPAVSTVPVKPTQPQAAPRIDHLPLSNLENAAAVTLAVALGLGTVAAFYYAVNYGIPAIASYFSQPLSLPPIPAAAPPVVASPPPIAQEGIISSVKSWDWNTASENPIKAAIAIFSGFSLIGCCGTAYDMGVFQRNGGTDSHARLRSSDQQTEKLRQQEKSKEESDIDKFLKIQLSEKYDPDSSDEKKGTRSRGWGVPFL